MTFLHIVSFKTSGEAGLPALIKGFLELKNTCLRDGRPLIKSVKGGKQVSTEGLDHGMQVTFIMEFESDDDLQFYLWKSPVHDAFKVSAKENGVTGVIALDFEDGVY